MFKELFTESQDITKEVIKKLKKGSVMVMSPDGNHISIDEYEDGVFWGIDQNDNDKEISSLKGYTIV